MKKLLFTLLVIILLTSLTLVACGEETTPATTAPAATTTAPAATTKPAPAPATTATAPAATTPAADAAKYGGVYKYVLTVAPARPIGYLSEGAPDSGTAAAPATEGLISVDRKGNIIPKLAVSWDVAADGKSIIVGLRKGVKFHDGSDFNAEVAKWNLDLMIEAKKTPDRKSVDIIDDYTIRINIDDYKNTILTGLATNTQMASKAFVDKNGVEAARWHPVGTGPFIFDSYERDAKLTYKKNPNYWQKGKPYLDGLEFIVIQDATVRKLAFQKGDIHRIAVAGIDAIELQKAGYEMITEAGGTFSLVPDSKNSSSPWSNINVRLAASYSLDRESLTQALGFGFARPAYQVYPGSAQAAIPNLDKHEYDPARAKSLLKEAGYPTGFKTVMHVFTRVIPNDFSTATAAMLRDVGIDIEVDNPTPARYEDFRYGGWTNGLMHHALNNPANMAGLDNPYWNGTQFPSTKFPTGFREGLDAAQATKEPDPQLIQAVIRIMHDDVMVIPYLEESRVTFLNKGVHDPGVISHSLMVFICEEAWLEPSAR
jgi:peptide/nickel transport system substrate-binding protein